MENAINMNNDAMEELRKLSASYREKMDEISDVFDDLSDDEKIEILFDYLEETNSERPRNMSEFDEEMDWYTPSEIAMRITDNFNIQEEYFWFDGYGNLESGDTCDVLNQFADDVDSDWLEENFSRYSAFNDFADELDELRDTYDDIVIDMEEDGIDVSDIPPIEED